MLRSAPLTTIHSDVTGNGDAAAHSPRSHSPRSHSPSLARAHSPRAPHSSHALKPSRDPSPSHPDSEPLRALPAPRRPSLSGPLWASHREHAGLRNLRTSPLHNSTPLSCALTLARTRILSLSALLPSAGHL
ncbi:unnamed protein product [Rangifer tarandus platyrhynchus]|uniref:Uncharacterized protein n=2 Tax=Rangifer tarandus platyrhynchus TaxID=3082113 RepID=A0ABN8YTU9_RANTA|nr:unnamed protein product [Rangifer tarandus platyrhynchus]CAI9702145.1 unnamed protein product [Rangifer tarandus platyrhynchus]